MSYYKNTTPTPNLLFDIHLKGLSGSEVKVLLIIIRQTLGYIDSKNKKQRKKRDWISQSYFRLKTGLSGRAVSTAIDSLTLKGLILVTDYSGNLLNSSAERRGVLKLYFASTLVLALVTSEELGNTTVKKVHKTKLNCTKEYSEIIA